MVELTCLGLASQWERDQVSAYPELAFFITKLKGLIAQSPERGLPAPLLLRDGRKLPCRKHAVSLKLFPPRYAIGYSSLVATYLPSDDEIFIIQFCYS